ncbi:hypothetical protein Tco_1305589 [Tanacetum coccineum]
MMEMVLMMSWWQWGGGGYRRLAVRGCGDRVDRVMGRLLGLGQKTRRKSFPVAGGGPGAAVVVAGKRERDGGTFQLFRHNALHAKAVEEKFEAFSSECFREDIRRLISSLDKVELNNLILNLFFYKMVLNCDMLRPRVLNGVARQGNGTLGVAVQ